MNWRPAIRPPISARRGLTDRATPDGGAKGPVDPWTNQSASREEGRRGGERATFTSQTPSTQPTNQRLRLLDANTTPLHVSRAGSGDGCQRQAHHKPRSGFLLWRMIARAPLHRSEHYAGSPLRQQNKIPRIPFAKPTHTRRSTSRQHQQSRNNTHLRSNCRYGDTSPASGRARSAASPDGQCTNEIAFQAAGWQGLSSPDLHRDARSAASTGGDQGTSSRGEALETCLDKPKTRTLRQ